MKSSSKAKANKTNTNKSTNTNSNNLDNLDNLDNGINILDSMEINIHKLIDDLQNIGNEKYKEEFIKNYSKIKEQIKLVDGVLLNNNYINKSDKEVNDNEIDDEENYINDEFQSNNISELLSMLETNEDKIFDSSNLTVGELNSLIKICNVLEKKITEETMNIIEIK